MYTNKIILTGHTQIYALCMDIDKYEHFARIYTNTTLSTDIHKYKHGARMYINMNIVHRCTQIWALCTYVHKYERCARMYTNIRHLHVCMCLWRWPYPCTSVNHFPILERLSKTLAKVANFDALVAGGTRFVIRWFWRSDIARMCTDMDLPGKAPEPNMNILHRYTQIMYICTDIHNIHGSPLPQGSRQPLAPGQA